MERNNSANSSPLLPSNRSDLSSLGLMLVSVFFFGVMVFFIGLVTCENTMALTFAENSVRYPLRTYHAPPYICSREISDRGLPQPSVTEPTVHNSASHGCALVNTFLGSAGPRTIYPIASTIEHGISVSRSPNSRLLSIDALVLQSLKFRSVTPSPPMTIHAFSYANFDVLAVCRTSPSSHSF